MYRYRSISMGFGLEGVNGADQRVALADRTLDWLLDRLDVELTVSLGGRNGKTAVFTASAVSSVGADIVQYRWDFGDGSPIVTTTSPTVEHRYTARRTAETRSRSPTASATGPSAV